MNLLCHLYVNSLPLLLSSQPKAVTSGPWPIVGPQPVSSREMESFSQGSISFSHSKRGVESQLLLSLDVDIMRPCAARGISLFAPNPGQVDVGSYFGTLATLKGFCGGSMGCSARSLAQPSFLFYK